MDEYGPDIITVLDEDGIEHEFEILDRIETDDNKKYVAMIPFYNSPDELLEDDGEMIILSVREENNENILEAIEDEDEFDEIAELFKERLADLYDFSDEEEEFE